MLVGNMCNSVDDGVELARETIDSGKSFKKLKQFAKENDALDKLEENG